MIYKCTSCGTSGAKLWRLWNTVQDRQRLFCAGCATGDPIDDDGMICTYRGRTDQIGDVASGVLIPAVPCPLPHPDGSLAADYAFWGYKAVPSAAADWWRALPTYKEQADVDHR